MRPGHYALIVAVLLWASLASLVTRLQGLPPLFLTGAALSLGALAGLRHVKQWRAPWRVWLVGIGALFTYHWLLILALRFAPPVRANLLNYLWPLLIVVLTPLFSPQQRLGKRQLMAALIGFAGAALAVGLRDGGVAMTREHALSGYAAAVLAALVWACYTHYSRLQSQLSSYVVSGFCLGAGVLALLLHGLYEGAVMITPHAVLWLLALGLGPMGLAFVAWDYACKHLDPRRLGVWSFATPVLSTLGLILVTGAPWQWPLLLAAALVIGAGFLARP